MTLLIGTVARAATAAKSHVVITADGRCIGTKGTERTILTDKYQKIYPVQNHPVVIAHHGENVLLGQPVESLLDGFLTTELDKIGHADISGIAQSLQEFTTDAATETLRSIPESKVVAFWVAGFAQSKKHPVLIEICWKKDLGNVVFEEIQHGNLVFGGDGKRLLGRYTTQPVDGMYDWKKIPDQGVSYAQKFHAKLYRLAEEDQTQEKPECFGGQKHQIVVTHDRWEWSIPPSV